MDFGSRGLLFAMALMLRHVGTSGGSAAGASGDPFSPATRAVAGVASAAELLERVRARMRESSAVPAVPGDAGPDLVTGRGLLGGWYDFDAATGVRWVARVFEFGLSLNTATHLRIEALLAPESGFDELRARLAVGGDEADAFRVRPGWNDIVVPLPPGLQGVVHCTIDAGGAWSPFERDLNRDCRALSIALRRLEPVALVAFRPPIATQVDADTPSPSVAQPVLVPAPIPSARTWRQRVGTQILGVDLEARLETAAQAQRETLAAALTTAAATLESQGAMLAAQAAEIARLQARVGALEAYVGTTLERRLAAVEGAQRELRADVRPLRVGRNADG
jgi:hypothetical protein